MHSYSIFSSTTVRTYLELLSPSMNNIRESTNLLKTKK